MTKRGLRQRWERAVALTTLVALVTQLAALPAAAGTPETCLKRATGEAWKERSLLVGLEGERRVRLERWTYVREPVEGLEYWSTDASNGAEVPSPSFLVADSVRTLSYTRRRGEPVAAAVGGMLLGGLVGGLAGAAMKPSDGYDWGGGPIGLLVGAGLGLMVGLALGWPRTEEKTMECAPTPSAAETEAPTASTAP